MNNIITQAKIDTETKTLTQVDLHYDKQYQIEWCYMQTSSRPCFNETLLDELNSIYQKTFDGSRSKPIKFQVLASKNTGIFNLGGDLDLFIRLIEQRDKESLRKYAVKCIEGIHTRLSLYKKGVTQISLIQGDALGGGFEAALAANVIIAERSAKLGLPEVLFNLFPGMGAFTLLSRRITPANAQKLILSGQLYSAEKLYELGVIDILAEDGDGEMAVYQYVRKENKSYNSINAMRQVQDFTNPITLQELLTITDIWVDAAFNISERDLRMMEKLIKRQDVRTSHAA